MSLCVKFVFSCVLLSGLFTTIRANNTEDENGKERYVIEGKIYPLGPPITQANWQSNTKIHVNGGEYLGFLKEDGSFAIYNVPSGSYVVEALNSEVTYEPVRVEINSKGKFRARKVNYIQTSQVVQVPYPLRMKPLGKTRYFQTREQWRVTDFLFNPMVLMMVLPMLLIMILPKIMNDPEAKKEMEQFGSLTKLPEVSDMVMNLFGGSGVAAPQNQQQTKKALKAKKRQ